MRGGNDCSRLRLLDLTETPPYVNDFIIDMYARILRLTPRKGHAGVFPVPFRVLDLGSGCGYKLHSLTTRYHAHGLGIELSVSNVLFANVNYKKQGVLQYCAGNGLSSPGLRGQFDLVMEYGGGIKYSGTMGSHTDECIALRTGLTLMKPGGALFRGQVDAFDSMKPSKVWECLVGEVPLCFGDDETKWCQHKGYTIAFMRLTKFYPKTVYKRFHPFSVFILTGVSITELEKLPLLPTFYNLLRPGAGKAGRPVQPS